MNNEISKVKEILKTSRKRLSDNPHIVATGIGYKIVKGEKTSDLSIICSVKEKISDSKLLKKDMIASEFDGIPTDIIPTGVIRAFMPNTGRIRPAPGGVSIGHINITAGTLGCLVKKNNEVFILSNNHVLANSNNGQIGDPILQPGKYDGGSYPNDHIANLYQYITTQLRPFAGSSTGFIRIIRMSAYNNYMQFVILPVLSL